MILVVRWWYRKEKLRAMKKIEKAKATFSLTKPLVEKLRAESAKEGLDMSAIVILALSDYFRRKERRECKR